MSHHGDMSLSARSESLEMFQRSDLESGDCSALMYSRDEEFGDRWRRIHGTVAFMGVRTSCSRNALNFCRVDRHDFITHFTTANNIKLVRLS